MSLTDDWKEGKIEDGFYYVKTTEIDEAAIVEAQCGDLLVDIPEMIVEILAPVPSYEECQSLTYDLELAKKNGQRWFEVLGERTIQLADANKTIEELKHFDGKNVCLENEALKIKVESFRKLLGECKRYIDIWGYTDTHGNLLYPQIESAIGESEE